MADNMINRILLVTVLSFGCGFLSAQTPWEVPADRNAKLPTAVFTEQNQSAGRDLYQANCKSCHGDPGKNNAIKLVPLPPDPASVMLQQNTDGSLHYKISEGRGTMPSFKNVLSSGDIWNVISYIRTYNKDYKQQLAVKPTFGGEVFDRVDLKLMPDPGKKSVVVKLTGMKGAVEKPIAGLEVKLFARRYFGNLVVDRPVETNAEGKAAFEIPKSLPGDSAGNVTLVAQLSDEDLFGLVKTESVMTIGVPTYRPPLNQERALWNVVQKTPIWLLITYFSAVLAVWGFILLVLLQLRTIYKMGEGNGPDVR